MSITDHERLLWVLAEEIEGSIRSIFDMVDDEDEWVESAEEARSLMARMRGIFVASLVGEIEESIGRRFSSVFAQLSDSPTKKGNDYWFADMPTTSSPRGRAKVMWAIRVAYTHGNGHVDQIDDDEVKKWVQPAFALLHFQGVELRNGLITISHGVTHPAMKTSIQISDAFS